MQATLSHGEDSALGLRFDWYQATVREEHFGTYPERLPDFIAGELGASEVEISKGLYGYELQAIVRGGDGGVLARVQYGGRNRWPNLWGSGDAAPAMASCLRTNFPASHLVTRADVAYDVIGVGSFDAMAGELLSVADERGVSVSHAGDWHRGEKGRTLYVGSRKSEQFVRLYEKGLEQRAKAPTLEAAERVPEGWTRFELSLKPQKAPRRLLAASAGLLDLWGFSLWTKAAGERLMALPIPRVERLSWVETDDAQSMMWLVRQYGALLERECVRQGNSWASVGELLGRLVTRD